MHSDELKELVEQIMEDTESDAIKVQCLNALMLNELNWGLFYLKEEIKELNGMVRVMKNSMNKIALETEGIKNRQ